MSPPVKSVSKVFPSVNNERPESYSNYEFYNISYQPCDPYQLVKRIGRGKYSDVFLAVDSRTEKDVVIKALKPVRKRKIRREVKILENLRGHPNIVCLNEVVLSGRDVPALVFEYISGTEYQRFTSSITLPQIQFYVFELAQALLYAHRNGVMHRDVKPQNIIVDFTNRRLKLIDWGLAEFYFPGMNYNVRVASRYYKSPELLVDYQYYDYSLDIWSLGCVMAGFIFLRDPLFHGMDNKDQLLRVLTYSGTTAIKRYLVKYQHSLNKELASLIEGYPGTTLDHYVNERNCHLCHPLAMSLVEKCLTFDHALRPTAEEVLNDEFFKLQLNS